MMKETEPVSETSDSINVLTLLFAREHSFHIFIIRFIFIYLFRMLCFLFCVFCAFILFCVLFLFMYIVVSRVPKFTEQCHRVKIHLQLINITYIYIYIF